MSETPELRFLVVDDQKEMQSLLESMLSMQFPNAVIDTSSDPVEALRKIKSLDYTVVLSDFNMDNMTGFELCQQARRIKPYISFVLMSGIHHNDEQARELGVEFIKKPFRFAELISVVNNYIPSPQGS